MAKTIPKIDLMTCPSYTPWGGAQTTHYYAPGLAQVSTAGHGGIWVHPELMERMPAKLREIGTWCGECGWYEEDCDWAVPCLAFQQFFKDKDVYYAVRTTRGQFGHEAAKAWLATPEGAECVRRHDAYAASVAGKWETGSIGGPVRNGYPLGCCWVSLSRGEERKSCIFPDWPKGNFFTDAELAEAQAQSDAMRKPE